MRLGNGKPARNAQYIPLGDKGCSVSCYSCTGKDIEMETARSLLRFIDSAKLYEKWKNASLVFLRMTYYTDFLQNVLRIFSLSFANFTMQLYNSVDVQNTS